MTVKLYCEKSDFNKKTNSYEAVFDFHTQKDVDQVINLKNITQDRNGTLLFMKNLKVKRYKNPRAGFWYNLPLSELEGFQVTDDKIESPMILTTLDGGNLSKFDFIKFKIDGVYRPISEDEYIRIEQSELWEKLKKVKNIHFKSRLIVRNVGCGNLNEINLTSLKNEINIFYDFGADVKFKDGDIKQILRRIPFTNSAYVVISHWDLDHYCVLLQLDDNKMKKIKSVLAPSKMPDTKSLDKVLNHLKKYNVPVEILKPAKKTGTKIDLVSQGIEKNIEIYRSTDGAKINQSGIVLTVQGERSIGVLTGDHHYRQLLGSVFIKNIDERYVMVVPHHGGNAGTFRKNEWNQIQWRGGAISSQSGRYKNLPQYDIHSHFTNQRFFCTDCNKDDYYITL